MSERDISHWLAKIPSSWQYVPLKRLADVVTGTADTIDADPDGQFDFVVRSSTLKKARIYTFDCEAVITAGDGAVGEVFHHLDGKFLAHQRTYVIHNFRGIEARFFFYYFSAFFRYMCQDGSAKTTVDSVRRWMLTDMPIAVPPREVQRHIVQFLDAETASIDNARAMVQKLTKLADELKIATVNQLCFGELRAQVDQIDYYLPYSPHRNTYLAIRSACGELPNGWRYLRFKNIARRTRNRNEDGNLEMLSLRQTGEVVYRSSTAQNQEPSEESIPKYLAVSPGNLVLNPMWLRGGAVGVSELRGAVSPDYRVFELSEEIDASYLGIILRSRPFIEQYKLLERAETTFDRRIQQVDLDNLPIPAPPLEIQKQIVRQIDEQFAADNVMRPTLTRVAELLTERRSALITAAVTGELEV